MGNGDTEAPVITVNGNNPAEILKGSVYADLGATVTDNVNNNLGYKTYVDGVLVSQISLDTSTTTTYAINYVATDQAGNTSTSTRTVIVTDGSSGIPNSQFLISNEESSEETATSTPASAQSSGEATPVVAEEAPAPEPTPTPEPEPESAPAPAPAPEPELTPVSEPTPEPAPAPEPAPTPEPTPADTSSSTPETN